MNMIRKFKSLRSTTQRKTWLLRSASAPGAVQSVATPTPCGCAGALEALRLGVALAQVNRPRGLSCRCDRSAETTMKKYRGDGASSGEEGDRIGAAHKTQKNDETAG